MHILFSYLPEISCHFANLTFLYQVAITRDFALYFMKSKISQDIFNWFADTLAPDEYIWPTLNHNPHLRAPGGYKGKSYVVFYILLQVVLAKFACSVSFRSFTVAFI